MKTLVTQSTLRKNRSIATVTMTTLSMRSGERIRTVTRSLIVFQCVTALKKLNNNASTEAHPTMNPPTTTTMV